MLECISNKEIYALSEKFQFARMNWNKQTFMYIKQVFKEKIKIENGGFYYEKNKLYGNKI